MRVLIDYNTRHELGAASEEMEAAYQAAALASGKSHVEMFIGGCKHRLVVRNKPDPVRTPKPAGLPLFFDPNIREPGPRRQS